jgi:AraC family transcriptional regulator of arabinose operon
MHVAKANVLTSLFVAHTRKLDQTFHLKSYLFRLQYEGRCSAVVQDEPVLLEPGSLLLLAPGESYQLHIEFTEKDHPKMVQVSDYYMYCEGSWVDEWWAARKRNSHIQTSLDESILEIWKQINLEKRRGEENKEITDYLLRILCLHIDRMTVENIDNSPQNRPFLVYRMKS